MRFAVWLLVVALVLPGAEAPIPESRAGQVLSAWLKAFNSGESSQVTAYLAKYEPEKKDKLDRLLGFREQTGGFNLLRVDKSEPLYLEALVKEREGSNFGKLTLRVSDGDTPVVQQFGINIVPRPADQPGEPRLPFEEAVKAVDSKASELTIADKFSGVILVARDGKIALEKAYGLADREKHISNAPDTRFRIGSMNKMFTATAILQLVGQGKVELGAPLGKYLTDYPNHDVATKVTIRHLLTHTGGTGDIFTPEFDKHRLELRTLDDYVKLYGSRGLEFEPGSKWAYSNYGFVLLGSVVEKVSGMTYYDYVRKNIFAKAGMDHTDSLPEAEKVDGRSTGYMRKDGTWVSNVDTLPWRGTSAGGGYSTTGDLFRFSQALSSGKLVKPELFEMMTSAQTDKGQMPPGRSYGFGMMVDNTPQGKRFGHGGGAPGMNGELRIYPESHTVVAVLANLDPPAASRMADFLDERTAWK